jgi:hypothetical protein
MDTMLLSKETLIDQLDALKVAWENEFTETIEFSEEEVEKWLVRYINRNDEVDDMLHQSGMDMREFENELFEIKTRHEIMDSSFEGVYRGMVKESINQNHRARKSRNNCSGYATSATTSIYKRNTSKQVKGYKNFPSQVSQATTLFLSFSLFSSTIICHIAFYFSVICENQVDP